VFDALAKPGHRGFWMKRRPHELAIPCATAGDIAVDHASDGVVLGEIPGGRPRSVCCYRLGGRVLRLRTRGRAGTSWSRPTLHPSIDFIDMCEHRVLTLMTVPV